MEIEFNRLDRIYQKYKLELEEVSNRVLSSGWYILGPEVAAFEKEFAEFNDSKFCIGLNSGLDALIIAFRTLGIGVGDEVIVPANTYIASVLGVTENKAKPIFIEPDEFYNMDASKIELAITPKTKAILAVHLYGQPANMREIVKIAHKHNLYIVEDCAQAHGAKFDGQMVGTFGDISCYSFYPTKNMGGIGDGGAIITQNEEIDKKVRMIRNYGSVVKYHNDIEGLNSRLDEIQAAFLKIKLKHLLELNLEREKIANKYLRLITNPLVVLPNTRSGAEHVWHLFVVMIKCRNVFQKYLLEKSIKTQIHYPIPPHLSGAYAHLGYKKTDFPLTEDYANEVLSLPLYNFMRDEELDYVINSINEFKV